MGLKIKLAITGGVLLVAVVVIVPPATLLSPRTCEFRKTFRRKCEDFQETRQRCEQVLSTFEKAYVGRAPCNCTEEAYSQLFVENPFTHLCNKTMFWSKTKDLVDLFCKKRNHFVPLQNTLLGNILDKQTWCGRKGSKDTFNYMCKKCTINPVSSFWKKASAEFAKYACGKPVALLNGEKSKPFDPTRDFAIEVKNLAFPNVTSLTVILVIKNNNAACSHESLQVLRNLLNPNIHYDCRTVTQSKILECIKTGTTTDACWT